MPRFRYKAKDPHGQVHAGLIEAASLENASQRLADDGLEVVEIQPESGDQGGPPSRLTAKETEDVVVTLAELSSAEVPLAEGLRAAAQASKGRVARALRSIAADVERGYALESVMSERGQYLPAHVRALVAAAARSHRLGLALDDLVEHHRATREAGMRVLGAIAYPLIVVGLTFLLMSFMPLFVVPQFKQMFAEFDLELPAVTQMVIGMSDAMLWMAAGPGKWIVLVVVVMLLGFMICASLGIGTGWSQRFASTMPLLGPIWQWSGVAAFARLLATMIEYGLPLPEAIRLASDGVHDPDVREAAIELADGVENGKSMSEVLRESNHLPPSITPFVRWGEQTGNLAEGLRVVSEMFLQRLQMRTLLLSSISPPVVFIFVGLMIGVMVVALFMPMVSLIQGLS